MRLALNQFSTMAAAYAAGCLFACGEPLPPPVTVPPPAILLDDDADRRMQLSLDARYAALRERWKVCERHANAFNQTFGGRTFTAGSPEAAAGAAAQAALVEERLTYRKDADQFRTDCQGLRVDRTRRIALMVSFAERLPDWDPEEANRARSVMTAMRLDGDRDIPAPAIAAHWRKIRARADDPVLPSKAAAGEGPSLAGIGRQAFEDCTIFAVASAAGRPYGLVAALATRFIAEGEWRGTADREDPQGVIEREGLNGDEVVLLVESFGQAKRVPSAAFSGTLREGVAVLVSVNLVDDDRNLFLHQVVLSRVFQHQNETWFEIIDSNLQAGQRHYLSENELFAVIEENGVAYRPEPGRTINLQPPGTHP